MNDLSDADAHGPDETDADLMDDEASETVPCPACGAEIYADAERCPLCGQYVTAGRRPRRSGWLWAVAGLAAVAALLVLATC
ncbi:MAG: hypothetical protein ACOC8F_00635 [Planctomycetota bacterium]